MLTEWKDATSYRQGERGKKKPTAWETTIAGYRVWVSCQHLHYPDRWVWTCRDLGVTEPKVIGSLIDFPTETAQSRALMAAREVAASKISKLKEFIDGRSC
jgi:hypothetical protein